MAVCDCETLQTLKEMSPGHYLPDQVCSPNKPKKNQTQATFFFSAAGMVLFSHVNVFQDHKNVNK